MFVFVHEWNVTPATLNKIEFSFATKALMNWVLMVMGRNNNGTKETRSMALDQEDFVWLDVSVWFFVSFV
jgi:hypothetical protein